MTAGHDREVCITTREVFERGAPVEVVVYEEHKVAPNDSGFQLLHNGFDADTAKVEDMTVLCLHCAIERAPEAGAGMDLAKANVVDGIGIAMREGDGWVVAGEDDGWVG